MRRKRGKTLAGFSFFYARAAGSGKEIELYGNRIAYGGGLV